MRKRSDRHIHHLRGRPLHQEVSNRNANRPLRGSMRGRRHGATHLSVGSLR